MGRLIKQIQVVLGVILCLYSYGVTSQIDNGQIARLKTQIPSEHIVIHTNADIFLAGETLYYQVYSLTKKNKPSDVSNFAYVKLIGKNNYHLFEHKLKLNNGLASSDFFMPSNVETGHYKLVAYTKWMENDETNPFFTKDVYVINPFTLNKGLFEDTKLYNKSKVAIIREDYLVKPIIQSEKIRLKTEKDSYVTRSKVVVELNSALTDFKDGNYSLSVRKIDSLEFDNKEQLNEDLVESRNFNLPEIRSEIISGKVLQKKDNTMVPDKIVTLSIPGKNFLFKNVKTNNSGEFYFNIYENYNDTEALIQIPDSDREQYEIILDSKSFSYGASLKFYDVILDLNIKTWLLKQSVYSQIESAYSDSKKDRVIRKNPSKVFYGEPTVTYVLDDYKRFSTVKETFIEVVQEAAIRKTKDMYRFKVYDFEEFKNNVFKNHDPLVLVDGYLIQNNADVVEFDCSKIEQVSLVRGIYFYGPVIYNGIIDIKTKSLDFKLSGNNTNFKKIEIKAPQEPKVYFMPNYKNESEYLKRIPDYRIQLLWMANLKVGTRKKFLEFYTSDVTGAFEIVLEGYSLSGDYIKSRHIITVQN